MGNVMKRKIKKLTVSETREKFTQLDKLLKPGEKLEVTRRGKAYARIELVGDLDPYEEVLRSIESLPEPESKLQPVSQNYKKILYGMKK